MDEIISSSRSGRFPVGLLVLFSGMAALSWEVLWQIKSTLALGVSAWGTALTLAITMGGMSLGAFTISRVLKTKTILRPARVYAGLEWVIGASGLFLGQAFLFLEKLDTWAYAAIPEGGIAVHILGIVATLGIPTMAMGATMPILGLIARQNRTSIAVFYGLNTLGAAAGTLLAAFLLIPAFGVSAAILVVSAVNILVGFLAWTMPLEKESDLIVPETLPVSETKFPLSTSKMLVIVFVTGFATFALEVAWFRSLTAAFMSTTDAFAIMLACVLLALGIGPSFVPALKKSKPLGPLLATSGILILLATPIIERFDLFVSIESFFPAALFMQWFLMTFCVIGAPVLLLGMAFPWVLDEQGSPRRWGILYGVNTLSAIVGSICAGWILLPMMGFAATAWLAGAMVMATGVWISPPQKREVLAAVGIAALVLAVLAESGVGKTRALGSVRFVDEKAPNILEMYEGPDSTVTAMEFKDGNRALFIDGFVATQQADTGRMKDHIHYMAWMGHLPMLSHPNPQNALVICFGTGQTANAVRKENPSSLDIVDINPNVLKLAHNFPSNEAVLDDSRVKSIVMDGRTYLRRIDKIYDVITLEPMPPSFAGTNALYSQEFYKLARSRLSSEGMIAQWLPFHLISAHDSASITKTFQSVFPNAVLWLDPPSKTGILLGSVSDSHKLAQDLPGFDRSGGHRDLSREETEDALLLDRSALESYAREGEIITDDNQFLSYGPSARQTRNSGIRGEKHDILNLAKPPRKN